LFGTCPTCPNNPKAVRDYDGIEFRLTKNMSKHWSGLVSYTWSRLWGNYTGLTTTDQNDGGASGRNSPDTTRAFDEPWFYFTAAGKSINGPLPTDRPNTFKGYAYYQIPWGGKRQNTTIGLFQTAYQGSPLSTYMDVGGGGYTVYDPYVWGHGGWANATTDALGNITINSISHPRTPWFFQSDVNLVHEIKVNKNNERQVVAFEANVTNLFNEHAVTQVYGSLNSTAFETPLYPGVGVSVYGGAPSYQVFETGYDVQKWINGNGGLVSPVILNGEYGKPLTYQLPRSLRFTVRYKF
jgi:hypothetical protein